MTEFQKKLEGKLKAQASKLVLGKTLKDLPPPELLLNCVDAANLIVKYLNQGKRMLLIGDYDADGIMATTIVIQFFRDIGFPEGMVDYIIPDRLANGYGVSADMVEYAHENGYDFIVTVDNGISAVEAVDLAKSYGIPVIITDHHTVPDKLPAAEVIVNPKQKGETFPFIEISGATVAWYLINAIRKVYNAKIDTRKYLDYVAITIISDVMPLNDINLAILNYGLKKIKERSRFIYTLIWNDWTAPTINTTEISFSLVPKINAVGRIDNANKAVELFLSKNQHKVRKLYEWMNEINEVRKEMSRNATLDAEKYIAEHNLASKDAIVVFGEYHEGIIGIIAGKIAEKYSKPTYIFSYNKEKDIWKGSARTSGNIHLYNLTKKVADAVLGFGGHAGAAGLAIKPENKEKFQELIEKEASKIPKEDFIDDSLIPLECNLSDIDSKTIEILDKYAPYGQGNPEPIFMASGVNVKVEREMKGGLHFKTSISDGTTTESGLFFNVEREEFLKSIEDKVDILFYPSAKYDLRTEEFSYEFICSIVN